MSTVSMNTYPSRINSIYAIPINVPTLAKYIKYNKRIYNTKHRGDHV